MDDGHLELIKDLAALLWSARNNHFHDFQSPMYGAPKMALVEVLANLLDRARAGRYDNNVVLKHDESKLREQLEQDMPPAVVDLILGKTK